VSPVRPTMAVACCLVALAMSGCGDDDGQTPTSSPGRGGPSTETELLPNRDSSERDAAGMAPADNSARNRREDGSLPTPLDQGSSEADRQLAARLRSALVDRDDLSTQAKNIKIIVNQGSVTLRGVVESAREHQLVLQTVTGAGGLATVDDRLDIKG